MTGWVLIVNILGGGWSEPHASEHACRLAEREMRIVWRWERGHTEPAVSCRRSFGGPGDSPARSRPPGREISTMRWGRA